MDVFNLESTPYPFKVKKIYNMEGANDGELYNGYMITMTVDPQDAIGKEDVALQQFPYEAVVESQTEIDVTAPLLEYNERGGHDELIRVKLDQKDEADSLKNAMDNARKRYERKYGQVDRLNKKIYRLIFPSGTKLSGKVLKCNEAAAKKNSKNLSTHGYTVTEEIAALNKNPPVLKREFNQTSNKTEIYYAIHVAVTPKLFWRVADVKDDEVLTGKSEYVQGRKGTEAADALFG